VHLLLDRLPFHVWTDNTRNPPVEHWSIRLPVALTETASAVPPPNTPTHDWVFDTGTNADAFAWRHHLESAGLDPDLNLVGFIKATSSLGASTQAPVRDAEVWLFSNVPNVPPFPLELDEGIAFLDTKRIPDPQLHRPLLGMHVFLRAGLKVELDFAGRTISLWSP
jgi:hypothetical protein